MTGTLGANIDAYIVQREIQTLKAEWTARQPHLRTPAFLYLDARSYEAIRNLALEMCRYYDPNQTDDRPAGLNYEGMMVLKVDIKQFHVNVA